MGYFRYFILVFVLLPLAACQQPKMVETAAEIFEVSGEEIDEVALLKERARGLAESELARLSAIEMLYRNQAYYYEYTMPGMTTGAYAKLYRQFTGYEIVDIERSDSLLRPLTFTVSYRFDLIGTEAISVQQENAKSARAAKSDHSYRLYTSGDVVQRYTCTEDGSLAGPAPVPLERPNYWETGNKRSVGDMSMHEVRPPRLPPAKGGTKR